MAHKSTVFPISACNPLPTILPAKLIYFRFLRVSTDAHFLPSFSICPCGLTNLVLKWAIFTKSCSFAFKGSLYVPFFIPFLL
jgi:hypothetical protein